MWGAGLEQRLRAANNRSAEPRTEERERKVADAYFNGQSPKLAS